MQPRELEVGDVVQIDPKHDPVFGACLMIVTDPKSWGAQGCVIVPHEESAGQAYYRVAFEHMEYVGKASWVSQSWTGEE